MISPWQQGGCSGAQDTHGWALVLTCFKLVPGHIESNVSIMPVPEGGPAGENTLYPHPKHFPHCLTATRLQAAMLCGSHHTGAVLCSEHRQQKVRSYIRSFPALPSLSGNSHISLVIPKPSTKSLAGPKSKLEEKPPPNFIFVGTVNHSFLLKGTIPTAPPRAY